MKFVRFQTYSKIRYGILEGEDIFEISDNFLRDNFKKLNSRFDLADIKLLSPVEPSKIIGIGLNYAEHIEELKFKKPETPVMFLKPSTTVISHLDYIVYPKRISKRVDYEGELAVVIGKRAKNVKIDEAGNFIFGYTIINDVTARDLQSSDSQWTRAKGFDTFAPIGPLIETDLEPTNLNIKTLLNGEIKQNSNTSNMIFNVYELVSFISQTMTLLPGDVIATGTPKGVGAIDIGDEIEIEIENIGKLKNSVR